MQTLIARLFEVSSLVRYVAVYRNGILQSQARSGLEGASSSESDKYEELIVNPVLLTLVRQRGEIDCGGAHYVCIRYGNFYEYVQPIQGGHVSIGIEASADPIKLAPAIQDVLLELGLAQWQTEPNRTSGSSSGT